MPKDNCQHRSAGMRCRSCMFFVRKIPTQVKESVDAQGGRPAVDQSSLGRCRRHAPTMSGWPVMFETDWCGDHKLDENKL